MWGCVKFVVAGEIFFDFVIWNKGKQWETLLVGISECCLCQLLTAKSRSGGEHLGEHFNININIYFWREAKIHYNCLYENYMLEQNI